MSVNHNLNSPHTSTSAFQNNSGLSALMNDLDDDDDEWLNNVDLEEVTDNLTSQLNHSFEDFDNNSGDSWIFPIGYEKREYQLNISRSCLFTNTLVCLPTGLGKTFIASVVIYNFYRWFPRSKIIFMAHSRPLVHQQIDACYKVVGIPPNETAELTGKISRDKRVELWNNKRVFFATPQVIQNDICDPAFPTNAIKLVIVDEAHKAKGRFSYCEVIKGINNANHKFRVVALSATPGKSDDVVEIIKNLLISKIEVRTEDSFDVKKYTFVKDIEIVRVQLGELAEIRDRFIEIYDSYLRKLIELKAISANIFNKGFLIKQQKDFHLQNHPQKSEINKLFSIAISLLYSLDLLERHGLQIFLNSFSDENNVTKLKYFVGQDRSLKDFLHHLNEKYKDTSPLALNINPLPSGEVPFIDDKNLNYGHLKYDVLKQQLTEYFNNGGAKVIIFCEYRDTVRLVYTLLLQLRPTVLPRMLMGQSGAVSQKDQLKAMEDFRSNKVNVLVTTSVCEEGIDVGEVDLVICFDISSKNPTRFVQRIGRTGRKRKGKVLILATEGKEEEDIKKVIRSKDKMNISIHGQKEITKNLYRNAPRLVPNAFNPKCVETKFNIPDLKIETKPDTKTNRIAGKKPKNETATSYPTRSITSHFAPTKKRSKDIPQEKNLIVEVQDDLVPEVAQAVRRSPVSEFSSGKSFEKIKNDFLDDSRSIIIKIEQNLILMTHIKWKQKTDLKALDERCQLFDDNVNENDSITLDTSWKKHLDDSMNLKQSYELSSQFEEVPARRINKNIYQSQEALVEVESRYGNQFSVPEPFNTPFKTSNFNKILNTPTPGSSGITKVVTAGKKTPMKDSPLFKAFQKQRDMSLSSTPVSSRLKTSFKHTQSLNISSDQPLVETSSTTPSNFSPKRNATSLEERSREMTALEFFGITSIDDIFVDDDSEDESSSAHNTATKVSLERDSYAKLLEQDDDVFLGIPIEDEIVESSVVDGISLNGTKEPKAKNDKFEINLEDIFVDSDESTEELEKNIESLPSDLSQSTTQEYYQKESPQKSITFEEPLMTKENVQVVNSCIIEVTSPSPKSILKRPRPNFSKLMNALKSSNFLSPTSSIPTVKSPVKGALQDTSNIRNKALVLTSNNNFTTSTSKYQNARFTSKVSVLPSSSKKFPSQRRQKKKVASPKITNFLLDSSLKSSRTADITQVNDPEESLVVSDGNDSEKNSPVALTAARGSRKRKRKNHFFDTQAGVDGTDSSDDEVDLTTLDGFIANETMDLTNVEEDDHAHYLQSIRSPSSRPNGNFKIPKLASPMSHSMIYSQIPQHDDEDDWEMGSFIVDTVEDQTIESEPDELEIAERLLEEKRKRANQRKNRGKRRRVVRVEDSSDEELKEMSEKSNVK